MNVLVVADGWHTQQIHTDTESFASCVCVCACVCARFLLTASEHLLPVEVFVMVVPEAHATLGKTRHRAHRPAQHPSQEQECDHCDVPYVSATAGARSCGTSTAATHKHTHTQTMLSVSHIAMHLLPLLTIYGAVAECDDQQGGRMVSGKSNLVVAMPVPYKHHTHTQQGERKTESGLDELECIMHRTVLHQSGGLSQVPRPLCMTNSIPPLPSGTSTRAFNHPARRPSACITYTHTHTHPCASREDTRLSVWDAIGGMLADLHGDVHPSVLTARVAHHALRPARAVTYLNQHPLYEYTGNNQRSSP